MIETVATAGYVGSFTSLALDAQGNPRIGHWDGTNGDLKYASAAIELGAPSPGDVWPVGASRTITWNGTGRVDLYLSVDGGASWQLQEERLTGGEYRLQVPHAPGRFTRLRLEREIPHSVALTDLFTIETSITLLAFRARAAEEEGGVRLEWASDPGPADLAGYRLERAAAGDGDDAWEPLVALTRDTAYHDRTGGAGSRYRLFGVNGMGEALLLGETSLLPARPLAAWPLPYRGGDLQISFATASGLGGGEALTRVGIYDLTGRLVRRLAERMVPAGVQSAAWDGRDENGRTVAGGVYFIRASTPGHEENLKIVVVR
jgi:hypothetical protein